MEMSGSSEHLVLGEREISVTNTKSSKTGLGLLWGSHVGFGVSKWDPGSY